MLNPSQAQISGRVITPNGNPLANATVRARNLINGEVGGSTSTAAAGQFSINVTPGSYLLEVVGAGGQIVGTSPFIAATAGTAITVGYRHGRCRRDGRGGHKLGARLNTFRHHGCARHHLRGGHGGRRRRLDRD